MAIHWIEWQFWSGKTSLAVYLSKKISKDPNAIIITNIKLSKVFFLNSFYFSDEKLLEMLRTINSVNDIERIIYWWQKTKYWLKNWPRKKFLKFYVLFDESWALLNSQKRLWKENETFAQYLNQCRKLFTDIYIISVEGGENNKILRSKVEWWYYVKTINFPFLKDFWIIRRQKKDENWNVATIKYLWKDQNGDYIQKEKPMDYYVDYFYKPFVWPLYDDLHKNIKDPEKYNWLDKELFNEILKMKPELEKVIFENEKFKILESKIEKNDNKQLDGSNTSI